MNTKIENFFFFSCLVKLVQSNIFMLVGKPAWFELCSVILQGLFCSVTQNTKQIVSLSKKYV